jgi:Flp pilus assembly protein TadG
MIDHLFGALLTFCLLAGGTLAVGSAMLDYERPATAVQASTRAVVQLPTVEVKVKRTTVAQTEPAGPTSSALQ